jgi:hypothetical protein
VKWIKLKRTQTVCTENERNRERKREKTERKHSFFPFFFSKKINSRQKNKKINKKNALSPGFQGWGALSPWCQGSHLSESQGAHTT